MKLINVLLCLVLTGTCYLHAMEQPTNRGESPRLNAILASLSCPKCRQKSFKSIGYFKTHLLACCTDFKPYKCNKKCGIFKCGFETVQSNNYSRHMAQTHLCVANTELDIDVHKKISALIKPFLPAWDFTCQTCDNLFPTKLSLSNHITSAHPKSGSNKSRKRKDPSSLEIAPSSLLIKEQITQENIFELLENLESTGVVKSPFNTNFQQ